MARNGKIARLPREIREQLNHRLADNEPGGRLLAWLNGLPAVQQLLARDFDGVPLSKQNLSEWRAGGFMRWEAQREMMEQARDLAVDASDLSAVTDGKMSDHLATVIAVQYAALLSGWNGEVTDELRQRLRALHGLCRDVVALRRGDQQGARFKLEQVRAEREREKTKEEMVAHFQEWLSKPAVKEVVAETEDEPEPRGGSQPSMPPENSVAGRKAMTSTNPGSKGSPEAVESYQVKPGQSKNRFEPTISGARERTNGPHQTVPGSVQTSGSNNGTPEKPGGSNLAEPVGYCRASGDRNATASVPDMPRSNHDGLELGGG
jgi:hypothetical protein